MIKKYILAIIAIGLAIGVGFFFGKKSAVAPEVPVNGVAEQATTTVVSIAATKIPAMGTTKPATVSTPTIMKDGSYLVSYASTGFSPKTLTIKKGKSVHFVNNSNKAMSLTTTDTTNNQVYTEFNQGSTVGRGGSYDFTFLTAGTWGYMNRNNQTDRGTVVVQ
ncbi:MAG: cupredoxin domain-containing protein [Candidatus Yonathbacteria bacterium]|nr:cupredoxin domain-containing protein [Candidatus Yonathbacteria bacterium]